MSVPPVQQFMSGEIIFKEGEPGKNMYIILEGDVEIFLVTGGGEKILSVLTKGEFFGEMALIDDSPRSATARCKTPTKVLLMSDDQLDAYIESHPAFAVKMIRNLVKRLRGANKLIG